MSTNFQFCNFLTSPYYFDVYIIINSLTNIHFSFQLDMWTFLTLTGKDLTTMGIHEESSQAKILNCIESLRKTPF